MARRNAEDSHQVVEDPTGLKAQKVGIMKPMDLSGLIKGLMVVIGIALALGKLERWAIREAFPSTKSSHSSTRLGRSSTLVGVVTTT